MSVRMIQDRLADYGCRSALEEEQALREITQEVVLAALGRTDFFARAAFHGGTCLRIFHGLPRFSEDLDFALGGPDDGFRLGPYLEAVVGALNAAGVRYLIVGGLAVNAHGYQRTTVDLDLVIQLVPQNVLAALRELAALGYLPRIPVTPEQFADSSQREEWRTEKGMVVFQMHSDEHRWNAPGGVCGTLSCYASASGLRCARQRNQPQTPTIPLITSGPNFGGIPRN